MAGPKKEQKKVSKTDTENDLNDPRVLRTEGKLYTYSMVEIVVGEEEKSRSFFMHEDVLRNRSEFFRRAFNGNWKESEDKKVELREQEPETFLLYAQYAYDNVMPVLSATRTAATVQKEYISLAKLYVLAEMLQDTLTRNAVMDAFISASRELMQGVYHFPGEDAVGIIYQGTIANNPARRLMVDFYANFGTEKWMAKDSGAYDPDFLHDVIVKSFKDRPTLTVVVHPKDYRIIDAVPPNPEGNRDSGSN